MPSIFSTDLIVGHGQSKVPSKYTVYTERWYLLLAALLINFSFGSLCTVFLPLPNAALDVICNTNNSTMSCSHLQFWLWTSYPFSFLLGILPSTALIIKLGILPSIYVVFIGGLLSISVRSVGLFVTDLENWLYLLILASHSIHALLHPICLTIAPTISHFWFPSGQRTLATSLIISGYFIGFLSSFVLTPNIVGVNNTHKDLINLSYINFAFAILPVIPLFAVRRSRPAICPSASADDALVNRRCKQPSLLTTNILVHCLLFANVGGAIRFTMQLHNQILCLNGYLFKFGLHAIILIGSTLISIILAGLTDSLYNHKQIYKISFAMVAISSTILSWANSYDSKQAFILISVVLLGFFGVGLYNVAVEMAVETNFPLHPAKTASLLFLSAYLGEIAYILVAVFARRSSRRNPYPIENCHLYTDFEDYSTFQIVITFTLLIFFLLSLVCLQWSPKRKDHENSADTMRINNVLTINPLNSTELRTRC